LISCLNVDKSTCIASSAASKILRSNLAGIVFTIRTFLSGGKYYQQKDYQHNKIIIIVEDYNEKVSNKIIISTRCWIDVVI